MDANQPPFARGKKPVSASALNRVLDMAEKADRPVRGQRGGLDTSLYSGERALPLTRLMPVLILADVLPDNLPEANPVSGGYQGNSTTQPNACAVYWDEGLSDWQIDSAMQVQVTALDGLPLRRGDRLWVAYHNDSGRWVPTRSSETALVQVDDAQPRGDGMLVGVLAAWSSATGQIIDGDAVWVLDLNFNGKKVPKGYYNGRLVGHWKGRCVYTVDTMFAQAAFANNQPWTDDTPATWTTNQHDVLFTDDVIQRISATGPVNFSGIANGSRDQLYVLWNVGMATITLTSLDATSQAANQFVLAANQPLPANTCGMVMYDGVTNQWRLVWLGGVNAGSGGGAALTATEIGYGSAANTLTGSNDFIFTHAPFVPSVRGFQFSTNIGIPANVLAIGNPPFINAPLGVILMADSYNDSGIFEMIRNDQAFLLANPTASQTIGRVFWRQFVPGNELRDSFIITNFTQQNTDTLSGAAFARPRNETIISSDKIILSAEGMFAKLYIVTNNGNGAFVKGILELNSIKTSDVNGYPYFRLVDVSGDVFDAKDGTLKDGSTVRNGLIVGIGTGGGTVTSTSVVTANGISGSVANPTTTPAITLQVNSLDGGGF
jgi:hypothetical protein